MSEITGVGVFENRHKALSAVEALRRAGFADDEVGLIGREDGRDEKPAGQALDDPRSRGNLALASVGGAAAGAVAGVGASLALAAGLVPSIGPVVAGGALTLLLAGSGAGAGSLVSGFFSLGIPTDEGSLLESELAAGRTLVTAHAGTRSGEALQILDECGATQRTIDVGPRS
jgi:hypothetical protein